MYENISIPKYQQICSDQDKYAKPWEKIYAYQFLGKFVPEHNEGVNIDEFIGRLKSLETEHSIAIGASIKDIVPEPEELFGKRVRVYGLTSRSYIALFNLNTITKMEILDKDNNVIETYDSNKTSIASLREYFERMDLPIPDEFQENS